MKNLLLLLGLSLCSSLAVAGNSCLVEMRSYNGQVIRGFEADRCSDASYNCERDLEDRIRSGRTRNAECVVAQRAEEAPEWTQVDQVRKADGKTAQAIASCKAARSVDFRCNEGKNYKCGACSEVSHSDESIYIVYQLLANGGRSNDNRGGRDDRGGWDNRDDRDDRGGRGGRGDDRGGWGRGNDGRGGRDDRGGWGPGRGGRDDRGGRGDDRGGWDQGRGNDGRGNGGGGPNSPRVPVRDFVNKFHFRHDKTAEAYNECVRQRASNPQCSQPQSYECTPCTVESHTDHSEYDLFKITYR